MSEIRPRIIGSETEYAVSARLINTDAFTDNIDGIANLATNYTHPSLKQTGQFLSNGSRFYVDVGYHPEYAGPEELTFESAVTAEFAGEQLVIDALHRFLQDREKYDAIKLRKRVVDDNKETWGYHLNFLAERDAIPDMEPPRLNLVGLHYATSLPLLGGGAVIRDGDDKPRYVFGQKINGLYDDYLYGTTQHSKAVINTRDEPHSDREQYRRVHLTSTDPHISPYATWLSLGSYSLVLRAIEQGYGDSLPLTPSVASEHPMLDIARRNNSDLTMRRIIHEIGGRTMRQLDVQHEILVIVSKTDHTDEEHLVLKEWEKAIDDLERDPRLLMYRSDAITRYKLIHDSIEKHGGNPDDMACDRAFQIDESYDTLALLRRGDTDSAAIYQASLPSKLRTKYMTVHNPSPEEITTRMFAPPQNTRARVRGQAIIDGATSVNWSYYKDRMDEKHELKDPYMTEEPNTPSGATI